MYTINFNKCLPPSEFQNLTYWLERGCNLHGP